MWIPESEPLRTSIIQKIHDSHLTGHPGRDATYNILSRRFFWPGAARDVRQFLRNCDVCKRTTIWREGRQGFLKPLPIPDRIWAELSIDFITELPPTGPEAATNLVVVTDRLTKGVILGALNNISSEAVARWFVNSVYAHHGLPVAMTSDRGPQFVSDTWRRICEILSIEQRLSTGFHPQTDGATERANQEVEKGLRIYITVAQTDWGDWLPMVATNINNRTAASTGISPFFFMHGHHVDPIPEVVRRSKPGSPAAIGEEFVARMKEASDWAQAAMAAAQDRQQASANKNRKPAPVYKEKDKVWLDLRNVRTSRSSKKLDWLHAKYTVTKVVSPHSVQLDVPSGIHPTFHVDLLRPAAEDPFPSQQTDDSQPPPVIIGEDAEWLIEEILCARWKKVQGGHVRREVLVKWAGYAEHSWEPLREYWDTEALDRFEEQHGIVDANDGPVHRYMSKNEITKNDAARLLAKERATKKRQKRT